MNESALKKPTALLLMLVLVLLIAGCWVSGDSGEVKIFAGSPGVAGSADGQGGAGSFNFPSSVATDVPGNLYVADVYNHLIRKITPAGVVNTVVGVAGQRGFTPGALPGHLSFPKGLAVSGGKLYVTLYSGVAVVSNRP